MHRFATMEEFAAAVAGPPAHRPRRAAFVFAALLVTALVAGGLWARQAGWDLSRLRAAIEPTSVTAAPASANRELARFDVTSTPRATVYVDGRRIGMTPIVDGRLSVGVHELRLERGGYGTIRDTINVARARNARHDYVLRPQRR